MYLSFQNKEYFFISFFRIVNNRNNFVKEDENPPKNNFCLQYSVDLIGNRL